MLAAKPDKSDFAALLLVPGLSAVVARK